MNLKQILFLSGIFLIIWFFVYYGLAEYLQSSDRKKFIFYPISYYRETTFWIGLLTGAAVAGFAYYKGRTTETEN
jgi:polyferredoxin